MPQGHTFPGTFCLLMHGSISVTFFTDKLRWNIINEGRWKSWLRKGSLPLLCCLLNRRSLLMCVEESWEKRENNSCLTGRMAISSSSTGNGLCFCCGVCYSLTPSWDSKGLFQRKMGVILNSRKTFNEINGQSPLGYRKETRTLFVNKWQSFVQVCPSEPSARMCWYWRLSPNSNLSSPRQKVDLLAFVTHP